MPTLRNIVKARLNFASIVYPVGEISGVCRQWCIRVPPRVFEFMSQNDWKFVQTNKWKTGGVGEEVGKSFYLMHAPLRLCSKIDPQLEPDPAFSSKQFCMLRMKTTTHVSKWEALKAATVPNQNLDLWFWVYKPVGISLSLGGTDPTDPFWPTDYMWKNNKNCVHFLFFLIGLKDMATREKLSSKMKLYKRSSSSFQVKNNFFNSSYSTSFFNNAVRGLLM